MSLGAGGSRLARRALTVPAVHLACLLGLVTAPLWLPATALYDRLARGRSTLRCGALIWSLSLAECLGLWACLWLWLRRAPDAAWYRLQNRWVTGLLGLGRRIYRLPLRVEGAEAIPADDRPLLCYVRHTSVADTLLPAAVLGTRYRMRYILKHALQWDPCLDVVGHRLPNYFARRGSPDPAREVAGVVRLLDALGPGDGVLMFPEGTRFSAGRRRQLLARLTARGDAEALARAQGFAQVLPPRSGGPVALLTHNPGADVLFLAHTGFDRVRRLADLTDGGFVGTPIHLKLWRVPAAEVPREPAAAAAWLDAQWRRVDAFVGGATEPG